MSVSHETSILIKRNTKARRRSGRTKDNGEGRKTRWCVYFLLAPRLFTVNRELRARGSREKAQGEKEKRGLTVRYADADGR